MKQRDILLIVIPTFIMVVLWVAFSVYHNRVSSTISEPLSVQIEPISQSFDLRTLENLKKRGRLNPIYESISQGTEETIPLGEGQEVATPSSDVTENEAILEQSSQEEVLEEEL